MDVDHQPRNETFGSGMHELISEQRNEMSTPKKSFDLLDDGSRRNLRGTREKMCQLCGEWIDLGRTLSGDAALASHEGSKRCRARVEMEIQKRVRQEAEDELQEMRTNRLVTPYSLRQQSVTERTPISPLTFLNEKSTIS